jgi:hypothetical protein
MIDPWPTYIEKIPIISIFFCKKFAVSRYVCPVSRPGGITTTLFIKRTVKTAILTKDFRLVFSHQ